MKYFLDTEFIEGFHKPLFGKRRHFIDLISIGVVREDGITYSAISNEWRYKDADPWVKENVILPLYRSTVNGDARNHFGADNFHTRFYGKPNAQIAEDLRWFFRCHPAHPNYKKESIEVYAYFADYDWVLLCSLFGRMIDLPKGMPMYCRDLKQMMDELFLPPEWKDMVCPAPKNEHDALADAKWNHNLYKALEEARDIRLAIRPQKKDGDGETG